MFSSNNKVFTSDSKAATSAEDVRVEGKRYPTNLYGRAMARSPLLFFLTIIVPFAFFIVGCIFIQDHIAYSLDDFRLRSSVPARAAADTYDSLMDEWSTIVSGEKELSLLIKQSHERSKPTDFLEVRSFVSTQKLYDFCIREGLNYDKFKDTYANLLFEDNINFINIVNQMLMRVEGYPDVCFTNDIEYGEIQNEFPICAPISSVMQYTYPQYDPRRMQWHMDGQGDVYQLNYLPRLFMNSNYGWFFDANFSSTNPSAKQLRSLITLATSPKQSISDYYKKRRQFVKRALEYIDSAINHPFVETALGGDVVENVKIEDAARNDKYKVGLAVMICVLLSWWHCGAFTMGVYTGAQVIFCYFATCGLYYAIYKSLPLLTYSAVIWVMTFGMHGTLSFYDMFVFSGIMATKGRQNNLSVPQRLCFTIRRITTGVWIANVLAIIIYAINTTSVFFSVFQFSVFMMIAALWNMYFIALPTPAFVVIHHFYFSNKRRNLQKQNDMMNAALLECRRSEAATRVLESVQENLSAGERPYVLDDEIIRARIGANRGINKKRYHGAGDFFRKQIREGISKLKSAEYDVTGAFHKAEKTKKALLHEDAAPQELAPFSVDDFIDIGPANPFGSTKEEDKDVSPERPRYKNSRMVPHVDLMHVPWDLTERNEVCWETLNQAIGQPDTEDAELTPPHVFTLKTLSMRKKEVEVFRQRWSEVGEKIGLTGGQTEDATCVLRPLVSRTVVRAQDPSYVVGGRMDVHRMHQIRRIFLQKKKLTKEEKKERKVNEKGRSAEELELEDAARRRERLRRRRVAAVVQSSNDNDDDGDLGSDHTHSNNEEDETSSSGVVHMRGEENDEEAKRQQKKTKTLVDPGTSGLKLTKLHYRWRVRHTRQRRKWCCGMFGSLQNESEEARLRRMMNRPVKRQGYTFFERLLMNYFVPFLHFSRYTLLLLFIALFVVVCVFGSRIKPAGLPTTLVHSKNDLSAMFASMDNTYGQRGTCTFCGPYYKPVDIYRTAGFEDVKACLDTKWKWQMNIYLDRCGVCNGNDDCVDCAGVVNGSRVLTECDGCEVSAETLCDCNAIHECGYCQYALGKAPNTGGHLCSDTCRPSFCGLSSECDAYTAKCKCGDGFTGALCADCEPWLLPYSVQNNKCTFECSSKYDSPACKCAIDAEDARGGRCTSCPAGTRGYLCDKPAVDCGAHGTYIAESNTCNCEKGWEGARCNASSVCHGRGAWMDAAGSPTGEGMCACIGHWRGPTCQLCDCLNGGMCDTDNGACSCAGAYTGQRCQTCAASCAARGTCPAPTNVSLWNTRTCIMEKCSLADIASETACAACNPAFHAPSDGAIKECAARNTETTCSAHPLCWWLNDKSKCVPADGLTGASVSTDTYCKCSSPKVWSGRKCDKCLAPEGATCLDDGTVQGCNGIVYKTAEMAMGTDECGICGGDSLCRGCDGMPGSGMVFDSCGVCGGNDTCLSTGTLSVPIFIEYMVGLENVEDATSKEVAMWVSSFCEYTRTFYSQSYTHECILESYLRASKKDAIVSLQDLYDYAKAAGRLGEVGFTMDRSFEKPVRLNFIAYRITSTYMMAEGADTIFQLYSTIESGVLDMYNRYYFGPLNITASATSTAFQPAIAEKLSKQSLWFAVGIGMAVNFVFMLVYFVSLTTAVAGTMATGIICFGTLTVCTFFPDWKLDAALQVCISCTIPIGVEYVIHLCSGYFDYLQTTTSHLFARDVSRRTAVQGAVLRSVPSICTSVLSVILCSIMFDVSNLIPNKRSGQVCITMHMIIILSVVLMCGSMIGLGPMTAYQHWTLSAALCILCGIGAVIAVLIIYGCNGVWGPSGQKILKRKK